MRITNYFNELKFQKLLKYAVPLVVILLIITSIILFKPEITGYVILSQEKTYESSLNLKINESMNYTWQVDNPGEITSIMATGNIIGNGTVKVYIEKDGRKYLLYKNK